MRRCPGRERSAVLLISVAIACGPSAKQLASPRRIAIDTQDFAKAVAVDDAVLDQYPEDGAKPKIRPINDDIRVTRRGYRRADFRSWFERERARLGPAQATNAEAVFGLLRAFRVEAARGPAPRVEDLKPIDAEVIAPAFVEAAPHLWTQVDALAASGELARALVLGATIVAELPPDDALAPKLAVLQQRAAALHAELVRAATPEQFGARALHGRISTMFGGAAGSVADDLAKVAAVTGLAWTATEEGGACPGIAREIVHELDGGQGTPATLRITFDRCEITIEDLGTTAEVVAYLARVKVKVPKVGWSPRNCKTVYGSPQLVESGAGTNRTYGFTRPSMEVCETPKRGFYGEFDWEEREEPRTERVEVAKRRHHALASGRLVMEIDGQRRERPFRIDETSEADWAYTGVEVPARVFAPATYASQAEQLRLDALGAVIRAARSELQAARAAVWLGQAEASAARGASAEADHAFFIASQFNHEVAPSFVAWMARQHHVAADVVAAVVAGKPLPSHDFTSSYTLPTPTPTDEEIGAETAIDWPDAGLDGQLRRSIFTLALVAGASQLDNDTTAMTSHGAVLAFTFSLAVPRTDYTLQGGAFRLAGNLGQASSHYLDFDFQYGIGLRYEGLGLTPMLGLGLDFTPGYDPEARDPEAFEVPPGPYAEYALRLGYAFAFAPVTLDATYSKTFRTSSLVPRSKRLDVRLQIKRVALWARYSEFDSAGDGVFGTFGSEHRLARTVWLLGGFGF